MNALLFLAAFVGLSLVGALVLWLRDRAPQSMEAHMKAFERELEALSPETPIVPPSRRRRPPPAAPARRHSRPPHRPAPRAPRAQQRGDRAG